MRLVLFIIVLFFSLEATAQFFNAGQSPPRMKWQQIETPHFKLIFPKDYSGEAQLFAAYLETSYPAVASGLNGDLRKIPVVIHNQGMVSNGFVSWAPKRVEMFPLPSQRQLSYDFKKHLSIHELRHVVQMNKLRQGPSRVLDVFFGEQLTGALAGLYLPLWFLEGDAVYAETLLTPSGRGRNPDFTNKIRAQLVDKGIPSYDKAKFGSYKHFVPNHYELGYFIVSHGYNYYGKDLWGNVLNNVARRPYNLFPFSQGIRKNTGLSKTALYEAAMDSLKNSWEQHTATLITTPYTPVSPPHNDYTDYSRPLITNDTTTVSIKSTLGTIDTFVILGDNQKEQKLKPAGRVHKNTLSASNNLLYYITQTPDIRWQHRSQNNIFSYDIESGKKRRLVSRSRYQTASVSPDGKRLACVYTTTTGKHSLHILNSHTGEKEKSIPFDEYNIIDPVWISNNDILFITVGKRGKAIALLQTEEGAWTTLSDYSFTEISRPQAYGAYIFYTSAYTGINNIFAKNIYDGSEWLLTSVPYGASCAIVDTAGKNLIYRKLTADGYSIVKTHIDSLLWQEVAHVKVYQDSLTDSLLTAAYAVDFSGAKDSIYDISVYSRLKGALNFHSWGPLYIDTDRNSISPGAVLFSQNLLSTTTASFGYHYRPSEKRGALKASLQYEGLYPLFSANVESIKRYFTHSDNAQSLWRQTAISTGLSIPFTFARAQYTSHLRLTANHSYFIFTPLEGRDTLTQRNISAFDYGFNFSNQRLRSPRDVYSPFAQSLSVRYAHTPLEAEALGTLIAGRLGLFFPGLLANNSIFFHISYQERNASGLNFSFPFPIARGHHTDDYNFETAQTIQSNYALPLAYPDLAVGPVVYIKRLRGVLFFDYTEMTNSRAFLRSYGVELMADTHILRFVAPVSLGIRTTYNHNKQNIFVEPLLSVSFDGF